MRQLLLDEVRRSVRTAFPAVGDDVVDRLTLEPPRDPSHGDFSSNVAFLIKDVVRDNPRKIAEALVGELTGENAVGDAEVAGPGFINFRVRPDAMFRFLETLAEESSRTALLRDEAFAESQGLMQVEFVSANPTGPMNVVSARAAAFGDSCVRLLRAIGVDCRGEYYVNDEGNQARLFGDSLRARFLQATGRDEPLPDDGYQGEYILDLGRELVEMLALRLSGESAGDPFWKELSSQIAAGQTIRQIGGEPSPSTSSSELAPDVIDRAASELDFARLGISSMVEAARGALERFGVEFHHWFRESELHGRSESGKTRVEEAEELLTQRGHVREEEGAKWFTSTEFGDDKDRVIRRSDGTPTYFLADMAYHLDKAERGFRKVIDVWGPDHHGYIKRLHSATVAFGKPEDWLEITIVQQVNLLRDGEPVKMSKRGGEFVTLDELYDEVGKDVSRFFFLMRRASTHLDFDLELAKRESLDNPVFYVQYAHARCRSIFRQPMAERVLAEAPQPNLSRLVTEEEIAILRTLLQFPEIVKESAKSLEPHRLVAYLRDVASTYHRFYTQGKQDAGSRVLVEDVELSRARLYLVGVLADVLKHGLSLLGIDALERM